MKKNEFDSFYLSKHERIGVYLLLLVLFSLLFIPWFYQYVFPDSSQTANSTKINKLEIRSQNDTLSKNNKQSTNSWMESNLNLKKRNQLTKNEIKLFSFDPNTLSAGDAIKLGIPIKVYQNLQKYLNAGGKIKSDEQFSRIYGMDESIYARIKDSIAIPNNKITPVFKTNIRIKSIIDINIATEDELIKLPFIGEKLANRIIKYRILLGGFIKTEQLLEVYGIQDSILSILRTQLTIQEPIRKISINEIEYDQLKTHPYFGYHKAKLITNYIKQHNLIENINQLAKIEGMDSAFISKAGPYIRFD